MLEMEWLFFFFFLSYIWIYVANINTGMIKKKKNKKKKKKNHLIFYLVQKRETNWSFICCQMRHFMIVLILYIDLLNLSWIKRREKKSIFEEYGAFKQLEI